MVSMAASIQKRRNWPMRSRARTLRVVDLSRIRLTSELSRTCGEKRKCVCACQMTQMQWSPRTWQDFRTDLVHYPEGGEEADDGDAGRREEELGGREPVDQQQRRREEVKLGLRPVQRVSE